MLRATLTIIGMYNAENNIFDFFALPDGVNRETVIQLLFSESESLELAYPNAEILRTLIGVWSRKQLPIWEKLKKSTEFEYNPIYNYDRTEEEEIERAGNSIGKSGSDSAYTENNSTTYGRGNTNEQSVAGFNEEKYAKAGKTESKDSGTDSNNGGGTSNSTGTAESSAQENEKRKLRAYGNIGTTKTGEMIMDYRTVENYSVYDVIVQDFIYKFCVMVY